MRELEAWRTGRGADLAQSSRAPRRPRGEKALDAPKGPGRNQPDCVLELFLAL